jgi:hypothetical protein
MPKAIKLMDNYQNDETAYKRNSEICSDTTAQLFATTKNDLKQLRKTLICECVLLVK